ncbi:unnamed protein product [Calypogeia fissa]
MASCENMKIENGQLLVYGKTILSGVPDNIVLTPDTAAGVPNGAFLGFHTAERASRHTLPIGILEDLRFMCCFRFKIWWMTQRMGMCGNEVPMETQFLLIESQDESPARVMDGMFEDRTIYTVCLPLLENAFRTSLQGNKLNELELCVESGDTGAQTSEGLHSVYVNSGTDPFEVIENAVRAVEGHLQSFLRREEKKMPGILDYFGWCTWDAFYTDVTADGVSSGLKSLAEGGTPARFLIIDDGWQSVGDERPTAPLVVTQGTQYSSRLTSIRENEKFQKGGQSLGLRHIVSEAKEKQNLKYVYVWHALAGYWGGVQPGLETTEHYKPTLTYPIHTPTILENQPDMEIDSLTVNGVDLVGPDNISTFYNELHKYLAENGVDGVKVDAQAILETLGAAFGGRVSVTRKFQQALEASIAKNFPDNGCIACMCHNTDTIYSLKQTAVVRASDDFWPRDPASHTIHIASVAYNSLFLGEFMQPDWDMFQSLHPAAEFHAAARAIGGCAIYVSDKPGQHDFNLLKKVVLPDGSVLRARLPGRPTRDSLFTDPARNGTSLLKIWNMNTYGGVIGAFNCQGAGWCKVDKKYAIHDPSPHTITGSVRALDVNFLSKVADEDWNGDCVMYTHRAGELIRVPKSALLPVTLKVLEYEIFTVFPIKNLGTGLSFAPIGLTKMFNSGGAIQSLSYEVFDHGLIQMLNSDGDVEPLESVFNSTGSNGGSLPMAMVKMVLRGCGEFGAYSSKEPRSVFTNSKQIDFKYDLFTGFVSFLLPVHGDGEFWDVTIDL